MQHLRFLLAAALILWSWIWLPATILAKTVEPAPVCGTFSGRRQLEHAFHRYFEQRLPRGRFSSQVAAASEVVGNIVLLEGDASIVIEQNRFDLQGTSLDFVPAQDPGRYRLARGSAPVEPALGNPIQLGDDATRTIQLSFEFPFFRQRWNRVFLNSDGNLTFRTGDHASTSRSLGRFLAGPPRIAPLFVDLDPSQGGTVRVAELPDRLVVTWEAVPEFDKTNQSTVQVVLEPSGRVSVR
jgi:hypothetical protein